MAPRSPGRTDRTLLGQQRCQAPIRSRPSRASRVTRPPVRPRPAVRAQDTLTRSVACRAKPGPGGRTRQASPNRAADHRRHAARPIRNLTPTILRKCWVPNGGVRGRARPGLCVGRDYHSAAARARMLVGMWIRGCTVVRLARRVSRVSARVTTAAASGAALADLASRMLPSGPALDAGYAVSLLIAACAVLSRGERARASQYLRRQVSAYIGL